MSNTSPSLQAFAKVVIEQNELYLLGEDDDYVVIDSIEFQDSEVMPVFSSKEQAQALCQDEWSDYRVVAVNLEEFMEEWLPTLNEAGVLAGVDFNLQLEGEEIEFFTLAKALADASLGE